MLSLFLIASFFATAAISADFEEDLPTPGILPDSPFYGLKRAFEGIGNVFTFGNERKAERAIKLSEKRLSEARASVEEEKHELSERLMEDYEKNLMKAEEIVERAQERGRNMTQVRERVAKATSRHIEVLENVLEKVPEQAKPAIQRALESSKRGQEEALDRIGNENPGKAANLSLEIAERRMNKARERIEREDIENAQKIIEDYQQKIERAKEMIEKAEEEGRDIEEIVERVSEATSRHIQTLEEVLERVPEEAKSGIENALRNSVRGQETAIEALRKSKPEKAEELENEIPEEVKRIREEVRHREIERIHRGIENITCEVDEDCIELVCPQMIGIDTPQCDTEKNICFCGPSQRYQEIRETVLERVSQ